MKKTWIVLIAVMLCGTQLFAEKLRFYIGYDEIKREKGELYQYSERYLGINDVVRNDETEYQLLSIRLLNDTCRGKKQDKQTVTSRKNDKELKTNALIPLSEEALMATNTAKKAESVAKQIYRIREAKMSVLSGEAEHGATDGSGIREVMKQLNQMEKELASLFLGNRQTIHHFEIVEIDIDEQQMTDSEGILMRFSKFSGPVDVEDLSGEPVYVTRHVQTEMRPVNDKKNAKMEAQVVGSNVVVRYKGKIVYRQNKLQ